MILVGSFFMLLDGPLKFSNSILCSVPCIKPWGPGRGGGLCEHPAVSNLLWTSQCCFNPTVFHLHNNLAIYGYPCFTEEEMGFLRVRVICLKLY
jgi:hypothetical protein